MSEDIRWLQRFANYTKALQSLSDAAALASERPLSKLEQQGIFALIGSRDASRSAFQNGLITDGEAWMDMIKARNLTSHTYNPEVADSVTRDILMRFYPAFAALRQRLADRVGRVIYQKQPESPIQPTEPAPRPAANPR